MKPRSRTTTVGAAPEFVSLVVIDDDAAIDCFIDTVRFELANRRRLPDVRVSSVRPTIRLGASETRIGMHCNTFHHPSRRRVVTVLAASALAPVVGWAGAADAATMHCYGFEATIVGTPDQDVINQADGVTDERDVIVGLGGNDFILGLGGDDVICGNDGDDVIQGGAGDDKIAGNSGDDLVVGDSGNDQLEGFAGDDRVRGGSGNDRVDGGDGNAQFFHLNWGNDDLQGEDGQDLLRGSAGRDELDGGRGTDELYGYDAHDQLFDRSGNLDQLWGGAGRDFLLSIDNPAPLFADRVDGELGQDECDTDLNDSRSSCEV